MKGFFVGLAALNASVATATTYHGEHDERQLITQDDIGKCFNTFTTEVKSNVEFCKKYLGNQNITLPIETPFPQPFKDDCPEHLWQDVCNHIVRYEQLPQCVEFLKSAYQQPDDLKEYCEDVAVRLQQPQDPSSERGSGEEEQRTGELTPSHQDGNIFKYCLDDVMANEACIHIKTLNGPADDVCDNIQCIETVQNFQGIPDFCKKITGAVDPEISSKVMGIFAFMKKSGINLSPCGGLEDVAKACRCVTDMEAWQYPPSDNKTSEDARSSTETSEDTSSSTEAAGAASASTEASEGASISTEASGAGSSSIEASKTSSSPLQVTEAGSSSVSNVASEATGSSTPKASKDASSSVPDLAKAISSSAPGAANSSAPTGDVAKATSSSPEAAKNASSSAPETAKAIVSASSVSSAKQPTPLRPVDVESLHKLSLQFKFQIQNGFSAITHMPDEAAKYSWRLVFKYNATISQRYRWELCEAEDHGRVVTDFNGQLIYGSILDVSSNLLVENGGLFNIEIKQNRPPKIEPAPHETVQSKQREIVSCESLTSCQTRKCVDKECDVKLVVSYSKLSISISTSVAIVTNASFQPCSQEECNYIQKCTDKCVTEKAAPGPAPPVAPTRKVMPNTLSVVMNVNVQNGPSRQPTTSGGDVSRKPVEQKQKGADSGSPSVQAPVSVYGEECVVTVQTSTHSQPATQGGPVVERPKEALGGSSPVAERPKEDLGVSRPTQRPKGDAQQPKEAFDGSGTKKGPNCGADDGDECVVRIPNSTGQPQGVGPKQGLQNDGMQPATGPRKTPSDLSVGVETSETKSAVSHGALTEPISPGNGGSTPGNGGSAPSRPQAPSAPSRADDTTTPSRDRAGTRPGEPVTITSGSTHIAVADNVLAVVAAIALLL